MNTVLVGLKQSLQQLGLWPRPGQIAPPSGAGPDRLRRDISKAVREIDGEMLLLAYQVTLYLYMMKDDFTSIEERSEAQRFKKEAVRQAKTILSETVQ